MGKDDDNDIHINKKIQPRYRRKRTKEKREDKKIYIKLISEKRKKRIKERESVCV